ncbi:hypothetical protein SRHO_G00279900 [Serrasalmus rhombeus]
MSMHYTRNDIQLGTTCWKYFRVCTVVIVDPGDSDIIRRMPDPQLGGAGPGDGMQAPQSSTQKAQQPTTSGFSPGGVQH